FFATRRTQSSALGAHPSRLCVRSAFCWSVFPLASPLPSTTSAAACAAVFGGFAGTTGLSDFPQSSISGLRPWPSPHGPPHHLSESSRLTWCNAIARRMRGSGWLECAHLLSFGVALVLVDEDERERFG